MDFSNTAQTFSDIAQTFSVLFATLQTFTPSNLDEFSEILARFTTFSRG
jgi:hypothetical protein